jgi:hypothetical protein
MVANKLPATFLAQIILLPTRFLAISFYLCTFTIGTMEGNFYLHLQKIQINSLIDKYL